MSDGRIVFSDYNRNRSLENPDRWYCMLDGQPLVCAALNKHDTGMADDSLYFEQTIRTHFDQVIAKQQRSTNQQVGEYVSTNNEELVHASRWPTDRQESIAWFQDSWDTDHETLNPNLVQLRDQTNFNRSFVRQMHHDPPAAARVNRPEYWKYQASNDHYVYETLYQSPLGDAGQVVTKIGTNSPFVLSVHYAAQQEDGLARACLVKYNHDPNVVGGFVSIEAEDESTYLFRRTAQSELWCLTITVKSTSKGANEYELVDVTFKATPRSIVAMLAKPESVARS